MTIRIRRCISVLACNLLCVTTTTLSFVSAYAGTLPSLSVNTSEVRQDANSSSSGPHVHSRTGAIFETNAAPTDTSEVVDADSGAVSVETVDINTATAEELAAALPGIGPAKAQRIVDWREANGPFQSVEQLLEVPGIGPVTLEKIRPYVRIGDYVSSRSRSSTQSSRQSSRQSRSEDAVIVALKNVMLRAVQDRSEALLGKTVTGAQE